MRRSSYLVIWLSCFLVLIATGYQTTSKPVYAEESSTSAVLSDKLKALQESIASKAAQIKETITKKLQNKVYVGKIENKTTDLVTIKFNNVSKTIKVTPDTQFAATAKSLKTLSEGDYISALGDSDDAGVLTAKRVSKFSQSLEDDPELLYGVVTEVDNSVIFFKKSNSISEVKITPKTEYLFGDLKSSKESIKVNKPIIIIGEKTGEKSYMARTIYIYPYTSNLKTPTASPSAAIKTPTPTTSKKISPTPTIKKS